MYSTYSDSSVLEAKSLIAAADGQENRQSLESYRAFLISMASARIGDAIRIHGSASDFVQATFASAYRKMSAPGAAAIRNPRNWLTGILLNKLKMAWRGRSIEIPEPRYPEPPSPQPDPGKIFDGTDTFIWAMRQLPEDQRLVVELRLRDGLEMREVADTLGITESCAYQRYRRAIQTLKEIMDPHVFR